MRRIYVLGIMLMTIIMAYAVPTKVMQGDTLVITVNSCNDCTKGAVCSNIPKGVLIVRSGHSALKYDLERVKQ